MFIPVLEKDSIRFKRANVFEAIKVRCSVSIFIGDYMKFKLIKSKEKKKLEQSICNISYATHYLKIWISYSGYEVLLHKMKNKNAPDSCYHRDLGLTLKPNSGIHKLIILNKCKHPACHIL